MGGFLYKFLAPHKKKITELCEHKHSTCQDGQITLASRSSTSLTWQNRIDPASMDIP